MGRRAEPPCLVVKQKNARKADTRKLFSISGWISTTKLARGAIGTASVEENAETLKAETLK